MATVSNYASSHQTIIPCSNHYPPKQHQQQYMAAAPQEHKACCCCCCGCCGCGCCCCCARDFMRRGPNYETTRPDFACIHCLPCLPGGPWTHRRQLGHCFCCCCCCCFCSCCSSCYYLLLLAPAYSLLYIAEKVNISLKAIPC